MRKIIIIIISIFLLLGVWQSCQAVKYPPIKVGGEEYLPTTGGLPGFIRYIYLFALGAAGIVALLAMLIGAIMYIFSAGKPDKAADAKNRIMSALLGIVILLASVLILRIINPDLVNIGFTLPEIKPANGNGDGEEIMWYCYGCCYTIFKCDLDPNNPETGCGYLTGTMTGDEAATLCENLVDTWCPVKHNSQASTTPCP